MKHVSHLLSSTWIKWQSSWYPENITSVHASTVRCPLISCHVISRLHNWFSRYSKWLDVFQTDLVSHKNHYSNILFHTRLIILVSANSHRLNYQILSTRSWTIKLKEAMTDALNRFTQRKEYHPLFLFCLYFLLLTSSFIEINTHTLWPMSRVAIGVTAFSLL